jgi:hypothetical protein
MLICFLLIKYKESNKSTVQVPLIIAFNVGKKKTQDGITDLSGKILIRLLCSIATTANTTNDSPRISLKMFFSVMADELI